MDRTFTKERNGNGSISAASAGDQRNHLNFRRQTDSHRIKRAEVPASKSPSIPLVQGLLSNPGRAPEGSDAALRVPGHLLFRAPQPRKLRVQHVDGFGGGFWRGRRWPCGGGWWRHEPAAGSAVATGGPAAVGAQAAQLLWGFIEKNIGVLSHGVFRTPHSLALVEATKQVQKCGRGRLRTVIDFRPTGRPQLSGTAPNDADSLPRSKSSTT
jgi:hypothetical protein